MDVKPPEAPEKKKMPDAVDIMPSKTPEKKKRPGAVDVKPPEALKEEEAKRKIIQMRE